MHETARRAWRRVLAGAAVLAVLVAAVFVVRRLGRSDEERLSEAVDDARDALVELDREEFLEFFAPEVRYRERGDRAALEKDLGEWIRYRGASVTIRERTIEVAGDRATIGLRCELGRLFQTYGEVQVRLEAVRTEDGWKVDAFRWDHK